MEWMYSVVAVGQHGRGEDREMRGRSSKPLGVWLSVQMLMAWLYKKLIDRFYVLRAKN